MSMLKRVTALLLVLAICFSIVGCQANVEEALGDIVEDAAKDYVDQKKEEAAGSFNEMISGIVGELENSYNQIVDDKEKPEASSEGQMLPHTGKCDHSTSKKYIEKDTSWGTRIYRIICKRCKEEIKDLEYKDFCEVVDKGIFKKYSIWHKLSGVSKFEYYTRKYAYYLGKDPSELDPDLLNSESKNERIIHYDPKEGEFPPEDQYFKPGTKVKITEIKPVRPHHHFLGWSKNGEKEPSFFPGDNIEDIAENTTLFACWLQPSDPADPRLEGERHTYRVEMNESTLVSIKCSCGLEVIDRRIDYEKFLYCWYNQKKTEEEADPMCKDVYRLYKSQDIGPLAIKLNSLLYKNSGKGASASSLKEFAEETADLATLTEYAAELSIELVGEVLEVAHGRIIVSKDKLFAKMYFEGIKEKAEKASTMGEMAALAISLYRMADKDNSLLETTAYFIDTLECLCGFSKIGFCVDPIHTVLRKGIEILQDCDTAVSIYELELEAVFVDENSEYLNEIFDGKSVYAVLDSLYLGGNTRGDHRGEEGKCPFDDDQYDSYPSVFEVINKIKKTEHKPQDNDDMYLLMYLVARSRHELGKETGLSLNEYVKLVEAYDQKELSNE